MIPTEYVPIDCDQHSVLELLAMRRVAVTVKAVDADGAGLVLEGVVSDVVTRDRAEFLELRDLTGGTQALRLDRLLALYDADGGLLWRQQSGSPKDAI